MAAPSSPLLIGATKPAGILSEAQEPDEQAPWVSAVIYGKGGVGKTTLLRTMPGRGLVLDVPQIEQGTYVLAPYRDRIKVLKITQWRRLEEVYQELRAGGHGYDWIATDTLTAMQELAKRKTVKERGLDQDPNIITLQDWGKIGTLMGELVYKWGTLPIHKIWLAQERMRTNDEGVNAYTPEVSPLALTALVPPQFLIGRMYTVETADAQNVMQTERRLRVGPHPAYVTKVRASLARPLPPVIREPNLKQIFGWCRGANVPCPEAVVETLDEGFTFS